MKKRKRLPDSYFEDQEFLIDEIDEEKVRGVLGKNPSADQHLKFELCGDFMLMTNFLIRAPLLSRNPTYFII